jgi:hypothetical protein
MKLPSQMTAAQEILLAADDLAKTGKTPFTEWDLTVAVWRRNKNRFGLRGYEDQFPDHKRVMIEIMTQRNPENPVRRQFFQKVRKNNYEITSLGKAEAARIRNNLEPQNNVRSPGPVFDAVESYVNDRAFRAWLNDPEEPRTWLGASTFLGLAKNDPMVLNDRIRAADTAVRQALAWCQENGKEVLPRGPHGGGSISQPELKSLATFIRVIQTRFDRQIDAIRAKRT